MLYKKVIILFFGLHSLALCTATDVSETVETKKFIDIVGAKKKFKSNSDTINNFATTQAIPQFPIYAYDFTKVIKSTMPGVISVVANQSASESSEESEIKQFKGTPFEDFFKNFIDNAKQRKVMVAGSGFFIKVEKDFAYIVTNAHIVENSSKIKIVLSDKTEIDAIIHGIDSRSDLAVLKVNIDNIPIEKRSNIKALEWGDSQAAEVGQWVIAIGNPFGLGNSVTVGIISAKSRDLKTGGSTFNDDFIQHSAQINVGNSGGTLIDTNGKIIGINTIIVTPSGGNVGIGFAIPSQNAQKVVEKLIEKQKISRGALGIKVQDFTKQMAESLGVKYDGGAIIASIEKNGPADKSGLKEGDIIVKFDDVDIQNISKLSRTVGDSDINSTHKVKIIRNQKEIDVDVKLTDFDSVHKTPKEKPEQPEAKQENNIVEILGMSLVNAEKVNNSINSDNNSEKQEGVFVLKVNQDSPADEVGLSRGDIIDEVNQQKVNNTDDLKNIVETSIDKNNRYIFIRIKRDGIIRFLSLRIDEESANQFKKSVKSAPIIPTIKNKIQSGANKFANVIDGFLDQNKKGKEIFK